MTNFKQWFGNSKIVDENGNPLVVYHGSPVKFDEFNPELMNYGSISHGFCFFTNKKSAYTNCAKDYAGSNGFIYECYLKMEKPYHIKYGNTADEYYHTPIHYWDTCQSDIRRIYRKGDFDGIIIENMDKTQDDSIIYLVPNGNQIKSVNNNGNWSSKSNNMYENLSLKELNERLEALTNSNCFVTNSPYDIVNLLKNKPKEYRILYDRNIDYYFIGDADSITHWDMIQKAYRDAYYYNMESFIDELGGTLDNYVEIGQSGFWDGDTEDENIEPYLWYIIFSPNEEWTLGTDGYNKRYDYSFGHIFTRGCDLSEISLWDALGVPENSEKLNESTELNDNFWKWFGNSKVTDEQGNPLVVYHGTRKKFDTFNSNVTNYGDVSKGFNFFVNDKSYAEDYKGGSKGFIYECYLKIENPLIIEYENNYPKDYYVSAIDYWDCHYKEITKEYLDGKYDGIIIYHKDLTTNGTIMYVVQNSNQIKSIDNKGTWSDSENIYETKALPQNINNNFDKWFKGSKVVDKDGNPLICYHGTPNGGFTSFKSNSHFTSDKDYAEVYHNQGASSISYKKTADNPMTYAVYLSIKNPFDTRIQKCKDIFLNEYQAYYSPDLTERGMIDWLEVEELTEWLKENHPEYDGIFADEGGVGGYNYEVKHRGISYIPFNSSQIKAVNNNGSWSNSNSIYESETNLNDNFWKWFNGSKMVDDKNQPIVFYHGTNKNFDKFEDKYLGTRTNSDWSILGHFFTSDEKLADKFTKGKRWSNEKAKYPNNAKVMPVYLNIKNPLKIPAYKMLPLSSSREKLQEIRQNAIKDGYDGIIIGNWKDSFGPESQDPTGELEFEQVIAFYSNQIKSINNNGNWSNDSNIYEKLNEDSYTYIRSDGKDCEILILEDGDNPNILRKFMKDYRSIRSFVLEDKMYFWDSSILHETVANKLKIPYDVENRFIISDGVIDNCYIKAFEDMLEEDEIEVVSEMAREYRVNCKRLVRLGIQLLAEDKKLLDDICDGNIDIDVLDIDESLEKLSDDIYATTSGYDILNYFKHKNKALRLIYDVNKGYYFIGDALRYIHGQLISIAYDNGFYYDDLKNNSRNEVMIYLGNNLETQDILMLSFFPKNFEDENILDLERSSDWYTHKFVYDFGTIYVHEANNFEHFELYNILGNPLKTTDLELPESINEKMEELESGIYATSSAYDVINWMKNKPKLYRVAYDKNIKMYFICDAYNWIHQDMLESAYRSGFYPNMYSEGDVRDYLEDEMFNGTLLFFAFSPNTSRTLDIEKSSDGYTRKYEYDFGIIYAHELTPIEDFDIYSLLGKPSKKAFIYESIKAINKTLKRVL